MRQNLFRELGIWIFFYGFNWLKLKLIGEFKEDFLKFHKFALIFIEKIIQMEDLNEGFQTMSLPGATASLATAVNHRTRIEDIN